MHSFTDNNFHSITLVYAVKTNCYMRCIYWTQHHLATTQDKENF